VVTPYQSLCSTNTKGMRSLIILAAALIFNTALFAQKGKVEGKVTDANTGQALAGVSVIEKSSGKGVATNTDGRYILNAEGATVSLVFSYNGVTQEVNGIGIIDGKVTTQDLAITPKTKTEEGVVVRATSNARKETAAAIISFQKNTNTVASVISAESIKRSPDRNTGEVLKRLPGASIQEGKFIVVRGLADRYNQAMLNGILLTSTEPDRKTFSFDLIPSSMIDNIVINKAFVPEYPGEWAGGLIQVNTKDIPAKGFFNVQVGGGFNTQTTGKEFFVDKVGKYAWLGIDDGSRYLPGSYTTKGNFDVKSAEEKTAIGRSLRNKWSQDAGTAAPNASFQLNGGFNTKVFGKTLGGIFGINYNKSNKYLKLFNQLNNINEDSVDYVYSYNDDKYQQDISVGAIGSVTAQLNAKNKVSVRSIVNVNTGNAIVHRAGDNFDREEFIKGSEFTYRQNTFFTGQLAGEHSISNPLKFKWYGAFNILDGFIPDQRRLTYSKPFADPNAPFKAIISNTLSQQSGSRIFQDLSDYIYTAGGDLAYNFNMFNKKQSVKGGYMLQIKDRLYDAKLFANYLPSNNEALKELPEDEIFAPGNFGNGTDNKFAFDAIKGNSFRYLANTILNAGFIQFDNQFSNKFKMVWGVRVEDYDQLVGSVKASDPRHSHTRVTDFLPGINATYKINNQTNLRLSGSQTVVRPELRELAFLNLYDFELNLSTQGDPDLKRTKITNLDLRYEMYPRAGEVITIGTFYKHFETPTEQFLNLSTINFINPAQANSFGVETELRKKLDVVDVLKNFTFQANLAYIYSRVKDEAFKLNRPLQGQSPYVLNMGLMYDVQDAGLTATLLYNRIGERIYLVGDVPQGSPDVYEAPRSLLDLQVSKKLLNEKAELRLNIADLLNQRQIFYQNVGEGKRSYQKNKDVVRFSRKYGSTIGLTFNYSF
jgi:TonB-dependent receptor